ncbi:bifunctional helix-turn-helix transcriptional regulator/GNAT family N-acetyltransferase [Catenuloplanes atrovinosus]|uniref:DNA-binding MarR family transcriptional regulator/GNAT superfamily N-acetyltransferase n=1 Tax=Catenuloplanes atrovinosus TaxID=137266 RepID=A0AAE3YTD7_9ACTN|nr:MarR family winged helix-turn-helix transcriptional regulator [Catenuloplanes atrovinosus]MDR7279514.1 DNA-binding MarR family transcriptional regulator/GNAT superfamily N-acetyltransferase [Catenuloplanes atrovinosus]
MDDIATVRAFNRFYTNLVGALQDEHLHTPYTLTEARVLYELAAGPGRDLLDLRRTLDLDPGYLTRIMTRFTGDGLVIQSRSETDGRRRTVTLTDRGRAAAATLDARATETIGAMLGKLSGADRARLLGAMGTITELLGPPGDAPGRIVVLRAPHPGDLGWIVQRHGAVYAAEHGFDGTFEAWVARIVADYATGHDPAREAVWIADVAGEPVGSIMCVRVDDTTAKLRILLVEAAARGLGVGGRLVGECIRFAREAGYARMVLETYGAMEAARRIYLRAGFTMDSAEPVRAHGHDLVKESWSLTL